MKRRLRPRRLSRGRSRNISLGLTFIATLALGLCLFTGPASAQIAFDAATSATTDLSTLTFSHTCSGSQRLLVVGTAVTHPGGISVSSITYNGVNLTQIRSDNNSDRVTDLWYLVAPATGANNVVVTLSADPDFSLVAGTVSLTGVDQTSPIEADNGATGTSTAPSVSVPTASNNAWVADVVLANFSSATLTVGSGQTQRWQTSGATASPTGGMSTEGPVSPPASVSMDWTISSSMIWTISAAAIRPAAAPQRRRITISHNRAPATAAPHVYVPLAPYAR